MKFTISKRLTIGYATIMLLVLILGAYVTLKLNLLHSTTREIASVDGTTITLTEHILDKLFSEVGFEKKYLISQDQDFHKKFWEIHEQLDHDMARLELLMLQPERKDLFLVAKNLYQNYISLFKDEVGLMQSSKKYPRRKFREEREKRINEMNQQLKEIIRISRSQRDNKINESSRITSHVLNVATITAGLVVLIGLLISFYNTQSINRSILLLQKKTKDIAKGKFEEIRDIWSPPEIKELADDFNLMCERLRELDELKKDFISHVSHKLRTPLTAMKEASSMLLEGTYADVPAKQHELLANTKAECERLIDSVNHILDLSRMEAKMMDYQLKLCHLLPIIRQTVLKLAPIAQRKKIDLELKPTSNLPAVQMDEERIGQVMENLIGNALKFASTNGKVVIETFVKNEGNRWIEVSVSDTGCGIPEENLEKIFEKFKRIEQSKETTRGTGLGLSIAKYIIADHGETIWAQSEPGKGSTFFFTLPVS